MENTTAVKHEKRSDSRNWYCRYHVLSDRMITVRGLHNGGQEFLYIDQEFNIYRSSEFYPWKTTE